jgi:hypothetical protein
MKVRKIALGIIGSLALSGAFGSVSFAEKPAEAKHEVSAPHHASESHKEGKKRVAKHHHKKHHHKTSRKHRHH